MDYTKLLPPHVEKYVGENDLFLEVFKGTDPPPDTKGRRTPLLFLHGAYTGSWMWSKFIPHFIRSGWDCYVMNLRSHYKSRAMDMTKITFEDYLEDIRLIISEVTSETGCSPVLIGFSLGGILGQKIAESEELGGLILIDSCVCREVHDLVPYEAPIDNHLGIVIPAPEREEQTSIDESEEDIVFQRKYLSMESSRAFMACGCWIRGIQGMSVDRNLVNCPVLVIRAVNNSEDDRRIRAEADYYQADFIGIHNATHTGLLIGQRYKETAEQVLQWLEEL